MFAGHMGAALALGRAARGINIGMLVFAAFALDVVLWLLVLLGWESVTIPAEFTASHQPEFSFPYSHGLCAALAWSMLAGAVGFLGFAGPSSTKLRAAGLVAAAVFSHWLLDVLVHVPELPLAGESSLKVGLGLWRQMPWALGAEGLITVVGLGLFLSGASLSRARKVGLSVLTIMALAFTAVGMTVAPPPPSAAAMAGSSLVTIVVVCGLAGWLGRRVP